nr:cardiotrophin-like cytokine factor 1 isoform X3 [Pelodiscus sinensis]|eukprot:XP_025035099.1 cardiotrophin-like cytokine factor 1 isoform X3 [Pelodiscus sinensis]
MLYVAGEISGDSWGIFAFLCAAFWNLPAVPALNSTEEVGAGQSIQKTYDLTRYLEHQLRTLAGTYLNYLGPPFNEPDFNPPRMTRAEMVPSATVDFELWRSLNDNARLAANYRAYTHLLCYLRGMDGQVAKAELRKNLGHFCTSLQGLVSLWHWPAARSLCLLGCFRSALHASLPSGLGAGAETWNAISVSPLVMSANGSVPPFSTAASWGKRD